MNLRPNGPADVPGCRPGPAAGQAHRNAHISKGWANRRKYCLTMKRIEKSLQTAGFFASMWLELSLPGLPWLGLMWPVFSGAPPSLRIRH
ncbi:MAG: hypothetical protein ACRYGK_03270 [Janthinobacterium lividum]